MNRKSQTLSANDQLKQLQILVSRSKSVFNFIELCDQDMGIARAEAVLFYKLLGGV